MVTKNSSSTGVTFAFGAAAAFKALLIVSGVMQLILLSQSRITPLAARINAERHAIVSLVSLITGLVAVTMFLVWIYKTKKKIVELGMTGAEYTPGFSVGCFFIPFANLVLPLQATRELWRASINPPLWRDQKSSPLVGVWWISWLITSLLPLAFFAASKFMVGMAALRFSTVGLIICAAISAVAFILTIRLADTVSAQINTYGLAQAKTPETTSSLALWDPNAAACWSVVFTPAFSAYIHGRNAEALGNMEEARMNRVWFYASLIYIVVMSEVRSAFNVPILVTLVTSCGFIMGWYFTVGKNQVEYVRKTFENRYQIKPLAKPIWTAAGCLVGFVLFVSVVKKIGILFFQTT